MVNYFLIGFMGVGKTKIGKALAKELGYSFLDTDKEIEKKYNSSIKDLFKDKGHNSFRRIEHEYLKTLEINNAIISTGGGIPCYFDNLDLIHSKGQSIHLKRSIDNILANLSASKVSRPLIEGLSSQERRLKIIDLMNVRHAFYAKANHWIYLEEYEHSKRAAVKIINKLDLKPLV